MDALHERVAQAISAFGKTVAPRLRSAVSHGSPESQLRGPLETLLSEISDALAGEKNSLTMIGESVEKESASRPDFAIIQKDNLTGYLEVKAPGKGADPKNFTIKHDQEQWRKFQCLPNLMYSDGLSFGVWRSGSAEGEVVCLGSKFPLSSIDNKMQDKFISLIRDFLSWNPSPPRSAQELARVSAVLCRLLRDEVYEEITNKDTILTGLAEDWRKLLFPDASNAEFADGYAQAVTFGLLLAKANGLALSGDLTNVATALSKGNTIIGGAFRILTDDGGTQKNLRVSLMTLVRVLNVVDWTQFDDQNQEGWLYFYEQFLSVYDEQLRRKTGSYYTPPKVVTAITRFIDLVLKDRGRFNIAAGFASPKVTVADPAMGTGTFLLAVLRQIAKNVSDREGPGAVSAAITAAANRLIGFEIQFGPFAVAQLRIYAEIALLADTAARPSRPIPTRLYVTDTLGDPDEEKSHIPNILKPLAESRTQANKIKNDETITIVLGNPPYKDKAKGRGGWVARGSAQMSAPLDRWIPSKNKNLGAHVKHLHNLYVYFWRWATWKVFGDGLVAPQASRDRRGIVCFISASGFLNGPGFAQMREDLRTKANEIFVINCSPEGFQPPVSSRIFRSVQQPICIVLAIATETQSPTSSAKVRYRSLPSGNADQKISHLEQITFSDKEWEDCASSGGDPFLPTLHEDWMKFISLDDIFNDGCSGVMPGRTWVIAPDKQTLVKRWNALVNDRSIDAKRILFHPHMHNGKPGDKHLDKEAREGLYGHECRKISVANDQGQIIDPVRYALRSFDRQYIIPDSRLLNRPNPELWRNVSDKQVYLTTLHTIVPKDGPAVSFSALIPDISHFKGSEGGRVYPLFLDADCLDCNINSQLLSSLTAHYKKQVSGLDVMAYIAAIAASPDFLRRYRSFMDQPGVRIPFTSDLSLFTKAVNIGMVVLWAQTFGAIGRPREGGDFRATRCCVTKDGKISTSADEMPDQMTYDPSLCRLHVGKGYISNVSSEVWAYKVGGRQVLRQWFSHRSKRRTRTVIGEKRKPSDLLKIQAESWLSEYTTELIDLINNLALLVSIEPKQRDLLDRLETVPLFVFEGLARDTLKRKRVARHKFSGRITLPFAGKMEQ